METTSAEPAPWYSIPDHNFISVEHPCYIKNIEKAVDTLGGPQDVRDILLPATSTQPISLSLHPEDLASRRLVSVNNETNNVLLKITVPKRTGRKRKRGSDSPFEENPSHQQVRKDASYMLQSLKDNVDASDVSASGTINRTHVFRSMPDFSYSTNHHPIMSQIKSKVLPLQYPLLKDFELDLSTRHNIAANLVPPPVWSTHQIPAPYSYRQNPAVKRTLDPETNLPQTSNISMARKVYTYLVQFDTNEVPASPDPRAPPLNDQHANLISMVTLLRQLFESRPIWTRRALMNQVPSSAPQIFVRYALAYVAYAMRSGPWRDAYIRLGVDPRTDPELRIYQTIMLQLVTSKRDQKDARQEYQRSWKTSTDKTSHIFKTKPPFPNDGKSWQLIDLFEDTQLKELVQTQNTRDVCDIRYFGWYKNGTMAKMKVLLKSKSDTLIEGKEPDHTLYERFLQLPDEFSEPPTSAPKAGEENVDPISGFLPRNAARHELDWAASFRAMCRAPLGAMPKTGRLSKSKPHTRMGYLGAAAETPAEDHDISRSMTPSTIAANDDQGSNIVDDMDAEAEIEGDMDVDEEMEDEIDDMEEDQDMNDKE